MDKVLSWWTFSSDSLILPKRKGRDAKLFHGKMEIVLPTSELFLHTYRIGSFYFLGLIKTE